ncbi:MAG: ubiquinone/menaquinone biosynthesis methyltransferase [Longimicrobiales bacterium]|nr:ubiquinone/menaquinone biosynthesis methyltransferase [Longimicrobiales bacterium]
MREGRQEDILPPQDEKAGHVRRMFGEIAPRYDLLNHLLTLNIDRRWRRKAVDRLLDGQPPDGLYLDACAGTMDLAAEVAARDGFGGLVVASDFARPMLEAGRHKVAGLPVVETCGDALRLPHPDRTFDGAIVGFGVRNFADLDAGLRELTRVLRPGGRLVILELSTPAWSPLRRIYNLYFTKILPWIGRRISGHGTAYSYLPASVGAFPPPDELAERMDGAGLTAVRYRRLLAGIAAIHEGTRRQPGR